MASHSRVAGAQVALLIIAGNLKTNGFLCLALLVSYIQRVTHVPWTLCPVRRDKHMFPRKWVDYRSAMSYMLAVTHNGDGGAR